jgi:hypothetical protein
MRFGSGHFRSVLTAMLAAVFILGAPQLLISHELVGQNQSYRFPGNPGPASPLKVRGGSIYAELDDVTLSWTPWGNPEYYATPVSSNPYSLDFSGYYSQGQQGCSVPKNADKGWTIVVQNDDSNKKPIDGLMLCSNSSCDPSKGFDKGGKIFIKRSDVTASTLMITKNKAYYHFFQKHGDGNRCDSLTSADHQGGDCDLIRYAILRTNSTETTCECKDSPSCLINVGDSPDNSTQK